MESSNESLIKAWLNHLFLLDEEVLTFTFSEATLELLAPHIAEIPKKWLKKATKKKGGVFVLEFWKKF